MSFRKLLMEAIVKYRLHNRQRWVAHIKTMLEWGRLSESQAKIYLVAIQPLIKEVVSTRNILERLPEFEEIYPDGPPDLIIGYLEEAKNIPVGLFLNTATHCLFEGPTGVGKTSAFFCLILAINEHNQKHPDDFISLIIWDTKNGTFSKLARILPQCVYVDTENTLLIGSQPPEGVPLNVWDNILFDIVASRGGLKKSAISLVELSKFETAQMNSPGQEENLLCPNFKNLHEGLKFLPQNFVATKTDYGKSASQVLMQLAYNTGNLFKAFRGLDLDKHIIKQKKHLIINACGLHPQWVRVLSSDILLRHLLLGRQYRHEYYKKPNCFIIIDEADPDVSQKAEEDFAAMTPASDCMRQGRDSGIGLGLGINDPLPVSRMVQTNPPYRFCFGMKDSASLREVAKTLTLPRGAEAILPGLKAGTCLYRGPTWPHTAIAKINAVPELKPQYNDYETHHPYVPSKSIMQIPKLMKAIQYKREEFEKNKEKAKNKQKCKKHESKELSTKRREFSRLSCDHLYYPAAQIFKLMGTVPFNMQIEIRKALEQEKLSVFEEIRIHSSNKLLQEPSPSALELYGKDPNSITGGGGIPHRALSHWIEMVGLQRKYEFSKVEHRISNTNHPCDAAWLVNGQLHAFEVVVHTTDNLLSHIENCFVKSDAVATLTIIVTQKQFIKKIQSIVHSETMFKPYCDRIKIQSILPFFKELWP